MAFSSIRETPGTEPQECLDVALRKGQGLVFRQLLSAEDVSGPLVLEFGLSIVMTKRHY